VWICRYGRRSSENLGFSLWHTWKSPHGSFLSLKPVDSTNSSAGCTLPRVLKNGEREAGFSTAHDSGFCALIRLRRLTHLAGYIGAKVAHTGLVWRLTIAPRKSESGFTQDMNLTRTIPAFEMHQKLCRREVCPQRFQGRMPDSAVPDDQSPRAGE